MKKNKVLKIVLIVLGALVALLAAAVLGVLFYLHSMAAGIPETLPDAPADSTQVTLTDDEIDKLLSGEITLEELADEAAASGSGEQEASASAPQQETGAASSPANSDTSPAASASRTESSSTASSSKQETAGTANSGTKKPSSSSGKQEASYEAEVKALLKQLYSVKARAEAELNSCIAGAKAEFKSLPESQQTQARKISIVLARSGRLYAMQASYDREVESIVSQMRAILTANGQSTALADQAMASYKAQKSAIACVAVLYLLQRPACPLRVDGLQALAPKARLIQQILRVGIPAGIENGMFQIGKLSVSSLTSTLGTAAIAANAVANTTTTFLNIPANAVGMAALTVVGQCLGAGEKDQAVYYSRRLMLFAYCGAWFMNLSAFLFANKFALGLFNLSPEAYAMALEVMVWFNIVSLFIWPSSFTMPNILRAAGDARFTMTVSIVSMWAFRVGFCYLCVLAFHGGLLAIWMGMYLDWAFRSLCFFVRFVRGKWLEQQVI